jgi:hypothetical protein
MLPSVLLRPTLLCLLTVCAFPAAADSFYKCKMPNGQVRYSDQPSKDSHCKPIAVRTFVPNTSSAVTANNTGATTAAAPASTSNTQMAPNTATQVAQQAPAPVAPRLSPPQSSPRMSEGSNRMSADQSPIVPQLQ